VSDFATRTVVAFQSDRFNLTEQKPSFVNPDCFGDDVGEWLLSRLRAAGHTTADAPGAEDFGWYLDFTVGEERLCAVIGHVPDECWFVVIEAGKGLLASMLGGRHRRVPLAGVLAIRDAIAQIPDVRNVRWFTWAEFNSRSWVDAPGAPSPA
jgi:hypothetical protein